MAVGGPWLSSAYAVWHTHVSYNCSYHSLCLLYSLGKGWATPGSVFPPMAASYWSSLHSDCRKGKEHVAALKIYFYTREGERRVFPPAQFHNSMFFGGFFLCCNHGTCNVGSDQPVVGRAVKRKGGIGGALTFLQKQHCVLEVCEEMELHWPKNVYLFWGNALHPTSAELFLVSVLCPSHPHGIVSLLPCPMNLLTYTCHHPVHVIELNLNLELCCGFTVPSLQDCEQHLPTCRCCIEWSLYLYVRYFPLLSLPPSTPSIEIAGTCWMLCFKDGQEQLPIWLQPSP